MTDIEKCNLILKMMAEAGYPDFYESVDDTWTEEDIKYLLENYEEFYLNR